jgi:hypothetical protein
MPRHPFEPVRVWLYHHLPAGLLWHPGEWLLAFMCSVWGVATLAAGARSNSLAHLLPETAQQAYAVALIIGAIALARGLSSIRWVGFDRYVVTRVPAYRLGLRLLGFTVALFVTALYLYAGRYAFVASIVPLAFVGMCCIRLVALGGPDDRR